MRFQGRASGSIVNTFTMKSQHHHSSLVQLLFAAPASLLLVTACAGSAPDDGSEEEEDAPSIEQREVWAAADDPALFSAGLERKVASLPAQGEVSQLPWAGSYWPTWQDSINDKWAGGSPLSPAKKYEQAFGLSGV